jgi:hypothetical protein
MNYELEMKRMGKSSNAGGLRGGRKKGGIGVFCPKIIFVSAIAQTLFIYLSSPNEAN